MDLTFGLVNKGVIGFKMAQLVTMDCEVPGCGHVNQEMATLFKLRK